ncbi:hypothetical protein OEZ86_012918 [Tetradesmus obliquus]|nr:hypothetical protein OEZ86_012918 [Tetradesmus obliquus]
MAARGGRGRGGWRGGRAGGRGGFQPPGLKDDEGNIVQTEVNAGPPPLFPAVELPHDPPELTAHDKLLGLRRTDLLRYYRASPYFLDLSQQPQGKAAKGSSIDEVEKYSDRFKARSQRQPGAKVQLASLLTLHRHHFPEELFGDRDRRLAARGGAGELFRRAAPEDGLLSKHLDLKSAQEAKGGAAPGDKPGGDAGGTAAGGAAAGDDDELAAPAFEEDDDDDDVMQEDDYYQGEYYDDDEGYEDDYGDGGDEGPIY